MSPVNERTTDGFWWARVVVLSTSSPFRYVVERYERVFPNGQNATWEEKLGSEGFPSFDNLGSANAHARDWLKHHEDLSPAPRS